MEISKIKLAHILFALSIIIIVSFIYIAQNLISIKLFI